ERLGRGVERPADRVFDGLGGVRLVEALGEEELEETEGGALPVEAVVLSPLLVGVERLVERYVALGIPGGQPDRGADVDGAVHALGGVGGGDRSPQRTARQWHP